MAISPIPQNIEEFFSTTTYNIDFYLMKYNQEMELETLFGREI